MSLIKIQNLTFSHDNSYNNIFDNVSFTIDTNWKLGFIGRNGRGKTTFLNLLMNKYEYRGKIITNVTFDYFPFELNNKKLNSYEIGYELNHNFEPWKLEKETSLLDMETSILERPFETLSKGEQTRILLSLLFIKDNNFLLIDEPTNHLDSEARKVVANYLKKKKGFILVSHDRKLLDSCVDHVLSINKTNIEIQQGNFSTWWENKKRQDNFELDENEKLKKDISRLERSAKQSADWSNKKEQEKHTKRNDIFIDTGWIGHRAAKLMKRSISATQRKEKAIEEKSKLLKNIEEIDDLNIKPLKNKTGNIIEVNNLEIKYNNKPIFSKVNFTINDGERIQLKGKNGCGKSSIIKLILGDNITYNGTMFVPKNIKISYISQDTSHLKGTLSNYTKSNNIDETLFKTILRKLGFERIQFDKNIESYSEGQKKKVLVAKSLCEEANLYIWDEPLNYIDVISRTQIEDLLLKYQPTMIFVEHDEIFSEKIATKIIEIK